MGAKNENENNKPQVVVLSAILPAEALAEITDLANAGKRSAADFRVVTRRHAAYLLERGVDADYLAYVLEYQIGVMMGESRGSAE